MGCILRECDDCDYCDGRLLVKPNKRNICPQCGGHLTIMFDEQGDHGERVNTKREYRDVFGED